MKAGVRHSFKRKPRALMGEDVIIFGPTDAIVAMVYHVRDEGLAQVVDPDSVAKALERLKWFDFESKVDRRLWRTWTNGQRLRWLQTASRTSIGVNAVGVAFFGELSNGES